MLGWCGLVGGNELSGDSGVRGGEGGSKDCWRRMISWLSELKSVRIFSLCMFVGSMFFVPDPLEAEEEAIDAGESERNDDISFLRVVQCSLGLKINLK